MQPPTVAIAGVDRTRYVRAVQNLRLEATFGARTTVSFETFDRDSFQTAYRPVLQDSVTITAADGTRLFSGVIASVEDRPLVDPGVGTVVRVSATSGWVHASQRLVFSTYAAGTPLRVVVADLVTTYLSIFGLTLDPAMVAGPPLAAAQSFDQVTVEGAFARLSDLSGWVYRLRPDNVIEWFPIGQSPRTHPVLSAPAKNIRGTVVWTQTADRYINRMFVRYGDSGIHAVTDTWTADGTQRIYPLTYAGVLDVAQMIVSRGVVNEGGTLGPDGYPVGGIDRAIAHLGVDGPPGPWFWYYADNTNEIHRTVALPAGTSIVFVYNVQFPQLTHQDDAADVALHGPSEDLTEAADIFTKAQADSLASSLLRRYKVAPRQLTLRSRQGLYLPGDTVPIALESRTIAPSDWLVTEVTLQDDVDQGFTSTLTLLEGTEAQSTWIDWWRDSVGNGTGSANATMATGSNIPTPIAPAGGGSAIGPGTAGHLALWNAPTTITDSIVTEAGTTITVNGDLVANTLAGALHVSWLRGVILAPNLDPDIAYQSKVNSFTADNRFHGGLGVYTLESTAVGIVIVGRPSDSLGGIVFENAASTVRFGTIATSPYGLTLQANVGNVMLTAPAGGVYVSLVTDGAVLPDRSTAYDLGALPVRWRAIYGAELWVQTLVAQDVMATFGGRIVVAPTTILQADVATGDTTILLKHNNLGTNDRIWLESAGRYEIMAVVGPPTGTPGAWVYAVTRGVWGAPQPWYAGEALVNTGTPGAGAYIDLYSTRGSVGNTVGPTIVGNVRIGWGASDLEPRWAIGELNGLYGYGASTFGSAFGVPGGLNVTVDATNGFRIRSGQSNRFSADTAGNLTLAGNLTVGPSGVIASAAAIGPTTGTGFYMAGGPTALLRVGDPTGNRLAWDGTTLTLISSTVQIGTMGIDLAMGGAQARQFGYSWVSTVPNVITGTYAWESLDTQSNPQRDLHLTNVQGAGGTPTIIRTYLEAGYTTRNCNIELQIPTTVVGAPDSLIYIRAAQIQLVPTTNIIFAGGDIISETNNIYVKDRYSFNGDGITGFWHDMTWGMQVLAGGSIVAYVRNDGLYGGTASMKLGHPSFPWAAVYAVNGAVQPSDVTRKTLVVPPGGGLGLDFLTSLHVATYRYREEPEGVIRVGFIGQEVAATLAATTATGPTPQPADSPPIDMGEPDPPPPTGGWHGLVVETDGVLSINYAGFVPILTTAVQELAARVAALETPTP